MTDGVTILVFVANQFRLSVALLTWCWLSTNHLRLIAGTRRRSASDDSPTDASDEHGQSQTRARPPDTGHIGTFSAACQFNASPGRSG